MTMQEIRDAGHAAEDAALDEQLAKARGDGFDAGFHDRDAEVDAAEAATRVAAQALVDLQAEFEEYRRTHTVADPVTVYGACAVGGGAALAAAKSVVTKWGSGVTVRMFNNGGTLTVHADPTMGLVHTSYKPDIAKFLAGDPATLATVQAGAKAARAGDVLEPWHEYDVKERNNAAPCDWATWVTFKAAFYDLVKSINPKVLVGTTVGVARFIDTAGKLSGEDMSRWRAVKGDVFGVDFDGGRQTTGYPNWTGGPAAVKAFVDTTDYIGWAVPEFIHERIPADPDGTARAAWLTKYGREFAAAGALYVHAFEYPSRPTNALTTAAEVAAWKALVDASKV